jgi:hypothetical protein
LSLKLEVNSKLKWRLAPSRKGGEREREHCTVRERENEKVDAIVKWG